jgi:predicted membrane protein
MDAIRNRPFRVAPRLIVGLGILFLGILWTLDNMDLIESEPITRWWPAILIVVGVVRLFDTVSAKFFSVAMIVVGTVILLDNLDIGHVRLSDLIPLGVALIGAKLIWDALRRRDHTRQIGVGADPNSTISAFALWAGLRRQSTSQEFHGGDATAIMGGVELDLRNAKIRDGEEAVLDTFAMWGGVEIRVPENWRVIGKVMPLMGGFEDKTVGNGAGGPVLVIQGTALMGSVEVKN